MRKITFILLLLFLLFSCINIEESKTSNEINKLSRNDFFIGGTIPYWIINSNKDGKGTNKERKALQKRANQMFDIVIPSSLSWDWVEKEKGVLDFNKFKWSYNWAKENNKKILVQHPFWGWEEGKPEWIYSFKKEELKKAMFNRIKQIKKEAPSPEYITVINEMSNKNIYEEILGKNITKEIFDEMKKEFPHSKLLINEHPWPKTADKDAIINGINNYIGLIKKLEKQNVVYDEIGLQLYFSKTDIENIGGIDTFIKKFNNSINYFYKETGKKIIITELGFDTNDEDYKAFFLNKFFKSILKNQNIKGLLIFHWLDEQYKGSALIKRDGSITKAGKVFYKIFNRKKD